jgi:hypothetical protein
LVWLLFITIGKDIGTLKSLRIETEDVEYDEYAMFGTLVASCILDRRVRDEIVTQFTEDVHVFKPSA